MTAAAMATAEADNDELVQRARNDAEALGRLYDRYSAGVFRYCVHRLFSRQVAEDVTSEIFLHVARQIRAFGGRCEQDFRNWLYAVATNQINAYIRSTRRRKALLEAAVRQQRIRLTAMDTTSRDGSDWADLYTAIATLSARDQTIVTLRGLEELPFEQIAGVLKMKSGAVRMAFGRALRELRKRLSTARSQSPKGDVS
jgi:RNA polymerase sigma-70 factor (ECF subfamily)